MVSDYFQEKRLAIVTCIIGFILNMIAYYPGFLSPDSLDQYGQAISGHYTDWHPTAMAALWGLLLKLYKGTLLILSFQLGLLWLSIYILLTSIKSKAWYLMILLFSLAPFVQNFAGYIIKDTHMAYAWLLSFSIMFRASLQGKKLSIPMLIICLFLLTYGIWVRTNALPGAIPLCYMWCRHVFSQWQPRWLLFSSVSLALTLWLGHKAFDSIITKPVTAYPQVMMYMQDITGVYAKTGINFYPSYLHKDDPIDTNKLRKEYKTSTIDHLWWHKDGSLIYNFNNPQQVQELQASWFRCIKAYPIVYLQNRFDGFLCYLRIKNSGSEFNYNITGIHPNTLGLSFHSNFISNIFFASEQKQANMPYMKPWFWILLNIVLFAFIRRFKNPSLGMAFKVLLLSSLLYFLPSFIFYATDTDFRYFYWNCIATCLALIILLANRYDPQKT